MGEPVPIWLSPKSQCDSRPPSAVNVQRRPSQSASHAPADPPPDEGGAGRPWPGEPCGASPTNSSLLGEPSPMLDKRPSLARSSRAFSTFLAPAPVFSPRYSATAPATCGEAIEVPEIDFVCVSL